MGRTRREVGFWTAVGRLRLADVFSVETISSIILGCGLGYLMFQFGTVATRSAIASTYVSVVAALVAIVFAGLALVASLLSDSYLRLLRTSDSGVLGFFRPFMLAIGIQVATIIGSLLFSALAKVLPVEVEPWLFGLVSAFFFASCFEIVVLTRSVLMHALLRTKFAEVLDFEAEKERKRRTGS